MHSSDNIKHRYFLKKDFNKISSLSLNAAIEWFLNSNIQNKDGAFYAWYDLKNRSYSFMYPEITGYAIRCLIHIYDYTKDPIIIDKALKAGNWLLKIIQKNGSIYGKYYITHNNDFSLKNFDKMQYTFDASICSAGLLDLYNITSNHNYLIGSRKILKWYLNFINKDGSVNAGYHIDKGFVNEEHWSRTKGIHHLKDTIALLMHFKNSNDKSLYYISKNIIKWGLNIQNKNGRFPVSCKLNETYTHAHCYAIEGLLYSGGFFREKKLINKAILGAKWLLNVNRNDMGFWNYFQTNKNRIIVYDATSQVFRIWILLYKYGLDFFLIYIQHILKYLKKMQCLNEDKNANGGIYYGQKNGETIKHVNSWATMFLIQSLIFLKNKSNFSNLYEKLF